MDAHSLGYMWREMLESLGTFAFGWTGWRLAKRGHRQNREETVRLEGRAQELLVCSSLQTVEFEVMKKTVSNIFMFHPTQTLRQPEITEFTLNRCAG